MNLQHQGQGKSNPAMPEVFFQLWEESGGGDLAKVPTATQVGQTFWSLQNSEVPGASLGFESGGMRRTQVNSVPGYVCQKWFCSVFTPNFFMEAAG